MIETERLWLIPADIDMIGDLILRKPTLPVPTLADKQVSVPMGWTEFEEVLVPSYELLQDNPDLSPWWMYIFVHRADQRLIGSGGFKGKPDESGLVEIGYEVFGPYRGLGIATEAAKALVDFAFSQSEVHRVMAHTLPQENPSNRLLQKLGFTFSETIIDPDDGEIWQWILEKK